MMYMSKYNIWKKNIAIGVVCLFLANQIAYAYPDALATQGLSDPKTREEVLRKLWDDRYEVHEGERLTTTGDEADALPETIAGLPVILATCPREKRKLRIANIQLEEAEFQDNTEKMIAILSGLAELGGDAPDLALFPELIDRTLLPWEQDVEEREKQIADIVARTGIAVGYCMVHGEVVYYHMLTPTADGKPKKQVFRKGNFDEEDRKIHIKEGCEASLFICSDMNALAEQPTDPQTLEKYTKHINGSSVVLIPSSIIPPWGRHWAQTVFNRFGVPVVLSNKNLGKDFQLYRNLAQSFSINSDGQIIKIPGKHEEAILITDVTTDEAKPGLIARPAMDVFLEEHHEIGRIYSLGKDKIPNTDNVIDKRRREIRTGLEKGFGPVRKNGQSFLEYLESMPVIRDGKEETGMELQMCIADDDENMDPLPFDVDNPEQCGRAHASGGRLTIIYTLEELIKDEVLVTVNGRTFSVSCAHFAVAMAAHESDSRSEKGEKALEGITDPVVARARLRELEGYRIKLQNSILENETGDIPQAFHVELAALTFRPDFRPEGRDYAAEKKAEPSTKPSSPADGSSKDSDATARESSNKGPIYCSHVTTLEAAELVPRYGFYGGINLPGGTFISKAEEEADDDTEDIWIKNVLYHGNKPAIIVFRIPRELLSMQEVVAGKTGLASLAEKTKVSILPRELIEELRQRGIVGLGATPVSGTVEKYFEEDILGYLPSEFIDVDETLRQNERLFGKSFLESKFAERLRGIGVVEDASRRYLSGTARWREYEIEVPPEYYVIPHSEVLDKIGNFVYQYKYLREHVALAKKLGLIPFLATNYHHPSMPLLKAVEAEDPDRRRPEAVSFDCHSDMHFSKALLARSRHNPSSFWRDGINRGKITGQDVILASDDRELIFRNFAKTSEEVSELKLFVDKMPDDYPETNFFYKRPDGSIGEILPDIAYMIKHGIRICGSALDEKKLTKGRPVFVSFDTDVELTDDQLTHNAKILSKREVAAVHITERPSEGFEFNPKALTPFLVTVAAGTHSRSFVQNLREVAPKAKEDEELIVAFDTDIGELGKHNDDLYRALSEVHGKDGLKNLRIVTGSGADSSQDGLNAKLAAQVAKAGKKAKIVIIARKDTVDNRTFEPFEGEDGVRIVSVNDKGLSTKEGVYDISVTHIIEDVLRDEAIRLINFYEPEDATPILDIEMERRSKERAQFLRSA